MPSTVDSYYFTGAPLTQCDQPLGVENGDIADKQITASSYYSDQYAPHQGRLNALVSWCPKISDQNQYLEVSL